MKNLYLYFRLGLILLILHRSDPVGAKQITLYQMLDSSSYHYDASNFLKSIDWANKAMSIAKSKKDENGMMYAYLALGKGYFYEQSYVEAMKNYFATIKLAIKRKEKQIESDCYNYIATIYYAQNDTKKAEEYFRRSITTDPVRGMSRSKANNYGYLAGIYYNLQKYDSSRMYYEKAIATYSTLSDSVNLILMKQNLAGVFSQQGKIPEAQKILEECLKITIKTKDSSEIGYSYFSIGMFLAQNNKHEKAIPPLKLALICFKAVNDNVYVSNSILALSDSYYELKMYKEAMDHFKAYKIFQDSTLNIDVAKEITRKEVSFTLEKKQLADSLKRAVTERENQIRTDEKFKRQSVYIYAGAGGLLLMLFLVLVLFRNNRIKQKANREIQQQKELVEEKQKEILDSIKYAKRIQMALLPSDKYIDKNLKGKKK